MIKERLQKQIEFITEIDKLKQIFRQNIIIGTDRQENDAEHSWHISVMAILLSEYSVEKSIDVLKVIKMLLIHDLVEIYAGDTFCYDIKGYEDKSERETSAAKKLFTLLPKDQCEEIQNLWNEFEALCTAESKFAACLDRLEPFILNKNTNGHTWKKHNIQSEKVLERNYLLKENAPDLWEYVNEAVKQMIKDGILKN